MQENHDLFRITTKAWMETSSDKLSRWLAPIASNSKGVSENWVPPCEIRGIIPLIRDWIGDLHLITAIH